MSSSASSNEPVVSAHELFSCLECRTHGVIEVKPRVIFSLVEQRFGYGSQIAMPTPSSRIGSLTTLEAACLVSIARLVGVSTAFEFGTFLGFSTALLALNTDPATRVISVDLPNSFLVDENVLSYSEKRLHASDRDNDEFLRNLQSQLGAIYVDSLPVDVRQKIDLVKADSRSLTVANLGLSGYTDLVFIDGGHDYQTASHDSKLALEIVNPNGAVIWHDYGSLIHENVTTVVDMIAVNQPILRIQSTMFAMSANWVGSLVGKG